MKALLAEKDGNTANQPGERKDSALERLSSAVFDNPQDFLNILKAKQSEIAQGRGEYASRADYFFAAEHANDPATRAVAQIVSKHFDEMVKFKLLAGGQSTPSGIDKDMLNMSQKFLNGNYNSTLIRGEIGNIALTGFGAVGTAIMGTFTYLSALTPVGVMMGFGTLGTAAYTAVYADETWNYPSAMRHKASEVKTALQSWPEINRHIGL